MNRLAHIAPSREQGVVLVITLILLLVLTLVGLAATTSTSLEEKMTANQRDMQVAFQAAEAALRNGESELNNSTAGPFDNTKGMFDAATSTIPDFVSYATGATTISPAAWADTTSVAYAGTLNPAPDSLPRFFIVQTTMTTSATGASLAADQPLTSVPIYQVFARGTSLSGKSTVVLETTYRTD